MTQSPSFVLLIIIILILTFALNLCNGYSTSSSSWKNDYDIGDETSSAVTVVQKQRLRLRQQQQQQQEQKRIQQPTNINDPDYIYPLSYGGNLMNAGHDGLILFSTQLGSCCSSRRRSSMNDVKEVKARYFFATDNYDSSSSGSSSSSSSSKDKVEDELEAQVQYYIVPSLDNGLISSSANSASSGEHREVMVKVWGGGGGGCDGGRGEIVTDGDATLVNDTNAIGITSNDNINNFFSVGSGGHYIQSAFLLPVGERLKVVIGGGGKSSHSLSHSLGGRGGYNGGYPGRADRFSGGGGGGGYSYVSLVRNSTVLLAAYGGDGGGNTTYCTARGGPGGRLLGRKSKKKVDDGGDDRGYYVAHDLALSLPSSSYHNDNNNAMVCLSEPSITEMTHNSATFIWDAGPCQHERTKELYVHKYAVHTANAYDSNPQDDNEMKDTCPVDINDYHLHEYIQRGTTDNVKETMTIVTDLSPSTSYCLHVKAFSIQGSTLGVRVVHFVTNSVPINEWLPVAVRQLDVRLVHEATTSVTTRNVNVDRSTSNTTIARSWCEHSSTLPSGRRGHTMTVVNDQVYIFGGATVQCVCELYVVNNEKKRLCSSKNVYSNELWHYDPLASIFTQLGWNTRAEDDEEKVSSWPQGREQHSMTALTNGHLVLIGGISSSNDDSVISKQANVLLNDVWTMKDPHRILPSLTFTSSNNAPIDLIPGRVLISPLNSELLIVDEESMCIHDISIKFSLDHICPNQIQFIKLTAPRLSSKGVANNHVPMQQSKNYETKIFVSRDESTEKECQHPLSSVDLVLSDDAEEWILSHASIPTSGSFRPASSLASTFAGLPINGGWELLISMAQSATNSTTIMENHHGRLLDWELIIDVTPCNVNQPHWRMMRSPPIEFTPRRLHTAVAVGNSIFLTGGYSATRRLDDMWRFDFDTNTWTDLTTKHDTGVVVVDNSRRYFPLYGQASFLSPWGLLAYGGMAKYGTRNHGHDMLLFDLFRGDWVPVPISSHSDIPHSRYLSSIGLLSNNMNSINNKREGPMILTFGGDGGLLHNAQVDGYGFMADSLFNDIWLLSPSGLRISSSSSTMAQKHQYDLCHWRWIPNSTVFQIWERTCGIIDASSKVEGNWSGEVCHLESILIAAWCHGQYQSL